MPVIIIRALKAHSVTVVPTLLQRVSHDAAAAVNRDPKDFWVLFEEILSGHYLEGGRINTMVDTHDHTPIVTVRVFGTMEPEPKKRMLEAIAKAVGEVLKLPWGNVWIHLVEMKPGEIFAGGSMLE